MLGDLYGDDDGNGGAASTSYRSAPPSSRATNHGFVGLLNQGTTCYLNSLLQTMYMSHELRAKLYALSDDELGADELRQLDKAEAEEEARKKAEAAAARLQKLESASSEHSNNNNKKKKDEFKDDPAYEPLIEEMKSAGFEQYHIDLALRASERYLNDREGLFNWLIDHALPDDWQQQQQKEREEAEADERKLQQEAAADAQRRQQEAEAADEPDPFPDEFKDDPTYEALIEEMKSAGFEQYHIDLALRSDTKYLNDRESLFNYLIDTPLPDDWQEQQAQEIAAREARLKRKQEREQAKAAADGTATDTAASSTTAPPKKIKYRRIPLRVRQLFASLQLVDEYSVSTQALTKSFGWKGNDVGVQHDITELNRVLFDALHRSLVGTSGQDLIPSLYRGTLVRNIGTPRATRPCG